MLAHTLKEKSIVYTENQMAETHLKKAWEYFFALGLSSVEKKEIGMHDDEICTGFLWHIFSFSKINCIKGASAEKSFDHQKKNSCYIFYQNSAITYTIENAVSLTASDFNLEEDIYIMDKDFTWTYVKTHESQCGPYFYKICK